MIMERIAYDVGNSRGSLAAALEIRLGSLQANISVGGV